MKIVLLNAPPRAGKDTAAAGLLCSMQNYSASDDDQPFVVGHHKMAESLKAGVRALFGLDPDHFTPQWLEEHKDTRLPELLNISPRRAYIDLSEKFVKPMYGKAAFGWMFLNRLRKAQSMAETATGKEYMCICSDLGFVEELQPLIAAYDAANILIIHIYRAGCAFKTQGIEDSRTYIEHPDITTIDVHNDGEPDDLINTVHGHILSWLDNAKQTTTA
jgi:hypothetical protein